MEARTEQVVKGSDLVEETRQKLNQINTFTANMNALLGTLVQATAKGVQTSTSVSQTILSTTSLVHHNSEPSQILTDSLTQLAEVAQELEASRVSQQSDHQTSQSESDSRVGRK